MKKLILAAIIGGAFLLFAPGLALAQEKIDLFSATYKINPDGSFNVTEQITYDFGELNKHGIFRYFPINYRSGLFNYNYQVSDISTVDENGEYYPYKISHPGKNIEIKIGDPDVLVTGKKIYVINYKLNRALLNSSEGDELYWNVTGNGWEVPIGKVEAKILLPGEVNPDNLFAFCYVGDFGSEENCSGTMLENNGKGQTTSILFAHELVLKAGQGVTFKVIWPEGLITQPNKTILVKWFFKDNWVLFLPSIVFFVMLYLWYTRGRDPKGRGVIIAEFEVPDNLSPAELGALYSESVNNKYISAEIIYLAIKGYLRIERISVKGVLKDSSDYKLYQLKSADDNLNNIGKELVSSLFASGSEIVLSDLQDKFARSLKIVSDHIAGALVTRQYYVKDPVKARAWYYGAGAVIIIIGSFCFILQQAWFELINFILAGIIIIAFGILMAVKTKLGVDVKDKIKGLKLYLTVAEKDRINFHNAPEVTTEQFEKFLPYAMVLGVEKAWVKQFEKIYNYQPTWYQDPTYPMFSIASFGASINNFNSSAYSALSSTPSSGSGGGSSGGGGGGGGGGSW
ncbi:MAG: hypothetical protein US58_C0015G0003 [Candidatus Magasanikbacteria bacterium GW2011_GWA2_37_8]|uniref:DUF2207 domain-containing protein n=1 Tax=Candidatus Magasanikbacteria bacterium GW2011_GWA2_37_8 TaxID=1619036 RepID=A0A0G0HPU1_9BACT|nr:MAG: hypothetical protein US58_C0015G0003 [Candidatus Magasanikbacteria bacterium GW2011_GWA2_37_8]